MSEKQAGFGTADIPQSGVKNQFVPEDRKLILAHLGFSFFSLLIGATAGLFQTLQRTGYIDLPANVGYYQLLTIHGVSLALVFTTIFIHGYLYSGLVRTLGGSFQPSERAWAWIGYYVMVVGSLLAFITILNNNASVLYTFYAPLQASPWFYIGLALLVVGSWIGSIAIFKSYYRWRRGNKGKASPLFAYMAVATMVLWLICTVGVAIEVVVQLIPWAFGWVERVDVSLSRTLFWYFGHALVYFWLLPAYIYWYVNIPRIIKGQIFSDSLPRLTFILFILYSIPVGFHHQLNEPAISTFWKFVQVILTFFVVIPSLMTAFSLLATFELAGRSQGATGLFGWIKKLPWKDIRFFAPVMGMLIFIPAGAGGIINASFQLNQVVHNTLWITGHFHMTVAATVLLTFMGISYWLVPALRGRALTKRMNNLAIFQTVLWVFGMGFMSVTMHVVGLLGEPRRTAYTTYMDSPVAQTWEPYRQLVGIGGIFLFISLLLFLFIIYYLWFASPRVESSIEYPIGEVNEKAQKPPLILERWSVWVGVTIVLILIAYAIPIWNMLQHGPAGAMGFRTW